MCLLKYIKGSVSDNLLAVNVLTDHKKPLQPAERQFYSFFFFSQLEDKFSYKKSFLGVSKVFQVLFNTSTAVYYYSRSNRVTLLLSIKLHLFKKVKTFSTNVIEFLECKLNFEHLKKK